LSRFCFSLLLFAVGVLEYPKNPDIEGTEEFVGDYFIPQIRMITLIFPVLIFEEK